MDTFAPPTPPTVESSGQVDYATETITFGNSYEQSTPEGLNARREQFVLVWTSLSVANFNTIMAFADAHGMWAPWLYERPGAGVVRQWKIAGPLQDGYRARGMYRTLRMPIRESFDPA